MPLKPIKLFSLRKGQSTVFPVWVEGTIKEVSWKEMTRKIKKNIKQFYQPATTEILVNKILSPPLNIFNHICCRPEVGIPII